MKPGEAICERCGHSSDWHRFDDYRLSEFPDPTQDPNAPFRCVGPNLEGCNVGCPDMVRPADADSTGPET